MIAKPEDVMQLLECAGHLARTHTDDKYVAKQFRKQLAERVLSLVATIEEGARATPTSEWNAGEKLTQLSEFAGILARACVTYDLGGAPYIKELAQRVICVIENHKPSPIVWTHPVMAWLDDESAKYKDIDRTAMAIPRARLEKVRDELDEANDLHRVVMHQEAWPVLQNALRMLEEILEGK